MIDFNNIENIYFLGIGGIGMSALARFANSAGKRVAGYDLTKSPLTEQLSNEGITIHYTEDINQLPSQFLGVNTLVVRTPAVPESHSELQYFKENGYQIVKRSELLGFLTQGRECIAVAGTHGKTSVSTMTTLLLEGAGIDTAAFLGGISRNFDSNLVLPREKDSLVVTEADEYDRSFLHLRPTLAVVTAVDADHLDIYGNYESVVEVFNQFVQNIVDGGTLLHKKGINVLANQSIRLNTFTYSATEEADFCVKRLKVVDGAYQFDIVAPHLVIKDVRLEYPGRVNVENILAASAAALLSGADPLSIKQTIPTYKGVQRRFDIRFKNDQVIYIDDYAHHPEEIKATVNSVKELYPGKKVLGVFQPHLFSRTRDFAEGFAQSLDLLDELLLLDIYPAREVPLPGVTSNIIFDQMKMTAKSLCTVGQVVSTLREKEFDILMTMGAGNIDRLIDPICEMLKTKTMAHEA
ncbi:MAG TPA: UDP-N-acetylmuramate--L-alanine ligase [Prolixibacteraceae bacterium]|mgnify:CR=1 FL=1|nr:UDP-N-acetylmuramate--L-alanine ligase [Prolixibacteraceae bacterium]